ncbi:hypothetical protein C2S52_017259 [Perilla frutescens var. hirtella]|nr:hypothetical protein C2S52_017259 [Perilla frutescens var. hirtella]
MTTAHRCCNSVGRVVFDRLVPFWREGKQASFETTIKFIITPNDANINNVFTNGIAFFIALVSTKIPASSASGNFGIFGPNGTRDNVFALEFDTYANEWDPNFWHIGIDLESRNSVAVKKIPGSLIGKEVTLQVNYEEATHVISAAVMAANSERHEVSFVKDLKDILEQDVQFGIAASTGEFIAIHDVVSWSFLFFCFI